MYASILQKYNFYSVVYLQFLLKCHFDLAYTSGFLSLCVARLQGFSSPLLERLFWCTSPPSALTICCTTNSAALTVASNNPQVNQRSLFKFNSDYYIEYKIYSFGAQALTFYSPRRLFKRFLLGIKRVKVSFDCRTWHNFNFQSVAPWGATGGIHFSVITFPGPV